MIRDQRSRRTATRAAVVVGVTLLAAPAAVQVATASPDAAPPTSCEIERLPEPSGAHESTVAGADPAGRYMVGRDYNPEQFSVRQALIWDNDSGTVQPVDIPGRADQLKAVNSSGVAVGWSFEGSSSYATPWEYRDGELSRLAGIESGNPMAINERGDIVGYQETGTSRVEPVIWRAGSAKAEFLPMPAGVHSASAQDLADDGTVIGLDSTNVLSRVIVWPTDGAPYFLPLPKNENGTIGFPGTIRIAGDTVAASIYTDDTNDYDRWSVRWDLSDVGEATVISDDVHFIEDTTEQGWVAGWTSEERGAWFASSGGGDVRLPGLPNGWSNGDRGMTVSQDGTRIGGEAMDIRHRRHAVTWTCS